MADFTVFSHSQDIWKCAYAAMQTYLYRCSLES